jgi:hypothetical protein
MRVTHVATLPLYGRNGQVAQSFQAIPLALKRAHLGEGLGVRSAYSHLKVNAAATKKATPQAISEIRLQAWKSPALVAP